MAFFSLMDPPEEGPVSAVQGIADKISDEAVTKNWAYLTQDKTCVS